MVMNDIRYLNCFRRVSGNRPRFRGDRLSPNDLGGLLEHVSLSAYTCENRGGKLDFQLRIAPTGSNRFAHHHPFPEVVSTILGSASLPNTACSLGKLTPFP